MRKLFLAGLTALSCLAPVQSQAQTEPWMVCAVISQGGTELTYSFAIDPRPSTLVELQLGVNGQTVDHADRDRPLWVTSEIGNYFIITMADRPQIKIVTTRKPILGTNGVSSSPAVLLTNSKDEAKGTCGIRAPR